ncbi:putative helicase MOV-10 [Oppia nitens]|uniref:putative helicase MOV-10 n=1 Tax=Oppia nitens TaxID=1686743 RepID=UPI0023DCCC72|nr:putative helicase MOV-10 [Oppia nitens]
MSSVISFIKSLTGLSDNSADNNNDEVIRVNKSSTNLTPSVANSPDDNEIYSECYQEFDDEDDDNDVDELIRRINNDSTLSDRSDDKPHDRSTDDGIGLNNSTEDHEVWNEEWNALEEKPSTSGRQLLDIDFDGCNSIKGMVTQCISANEIEVDDKHRVKYTRSTFGIIYTGDLISVETNDKKEVTIKPLRYKILTGKITGNDKQFFRYIFSRHAFIRKTKDTEHLRVGDVVKVLTIETRSNSFNWRAILYTQVYDTIITGLSMDQIDSYTNELMMNKNMVEVLAKISFGEMIVNNNKKILIYIRNKGNNLQTLTSVDNEEGESQIKFHSFRAIYGKPCDSPAPYEIPANSECYVELVCDAKYCGDYSDLIIFNFIGFKIGRFATVSVIDTVGGVNRENSTVKRRRIFGADTWIVPGEKVWNPNKHIFDKLERYGIPESVWRAIENNWAIESVFPEVKEKLMPENYRKKFHALMFLEEAENQLMLQKFDMRNVQFKRNGRFVSLTVPGLAEGRPSLIMGDRLFCFEEEEQQVISKETKRIAFEGYIHDLKKNEILIRFNEDFHKNFNGGDYKIAFQASRTTYRRCHHAIDLSPHILDQVLFPNKVVLKQAFKNIPYDSINWFNKSLNTQQKLSVIGALRGQSRPSPYIIFGPPGTGKTVTIVESILQVFDKISHSRIIACTCANSSADLIVEKLLESGRVTDKDLIRVTALHRLHQIPESVKSVTKVADEDEKQWIYHRIIVTTTSQAGITFRHKISPSHFTHVFIDEAGQVIEPESLIPITMCAIAHGVVVLAGDHKQLGPVVQSTRAKDGRLERSLMERLMLSCEPYGRKEEYKKYGYYNPRFVTKLVQNYRSDERIMKISSQLFYENELKFNLESDAKLLKALDFNFPINFIGVQGDDRQDTDCPSWYNPQEIMVICTYLEKLYKAGVQPNDIGIITPYRKQVSKLRSHISELDLMDCRVATIEEFQGLEKKVIIVSMVRSNVHNLSHDMKYNLGFVHNAKRFNVAVSRAMTLLICIGDPYLLSNDKCWKQLLDYCVENNSYKGKPFNTSSSENNSNKGYRSKNHRNSRRKK